MFVEKTSTSDMLRNVQVLSYPRIYKYFSTLINADVRSIIAYRNSYFQFADIC